MSLRVQKKVDRILAAVPGALIGESDWGRTIGVAIPKDAKLAPGYYIARVRRDKDGKVIGEYEATNAQVDEIIRRLTT